MLPPSTSKAPRVPKAPKINHCERRDNILTQFSIIEVARLCNIQIKEQSRAEIRCRCPFCNNKRNKMTASLNESKGLFHCFRCGEGFNAVSLYAEIYGIDTKEAYQDLMDKLG